MGPFCWPQRLCQPCWGHFDHRGPVHNKKPQTEVNHRGPVNNNKYRGPVNHKGPVNHSGPVNHREPEALSIALNHNKPQCSCQSQSLTKAQSTTEAMSTTRTTKTPSTREAQSNRGYTWVKIWLTPCMGIYTQTTYYYFVVCIQFYTCVCIYSKSHPFQLAESCKTKTRFEVLFHQTNICSTTV